MMEILLRAGANVLPRPPQAIPHWDIPEGGGDSVSERSGSRTLCAHSVPGVSIASRTSFLFCRRFLKTHCE